MPGYDINRFVDLSHTDVSELICSICQDVLRDPVVTNCCLTTFCRECISNWLKINNTCPYDRKQLKEIELNHPPRNLTNMLGKLNIRCQYEENGCQQILSLDNLNNHEISCIFKEKVCGKCYCKLMRDHNCVQSLLEANQRMIETIYTLETELRSVSNAATQIPTQNQNELQVISTQPTHTGTRTGMRSNYLKPNMGCLAILIAHIISLIIISMYLCKNLCRHLLENNTELND